MSSPESLSTAHVPAEKDRKCPYCHVGFTSSSLGRHLDLYIKPKNAKAADGIHNVAEIQRLRGSVTRRRVRNTSGLQSAKRGGSPLSISAQSSSNVTNEGPPSVPPFPMTMTESYGAAGSKKMVISNLNRLTWEVTGVMNDIPSDRRSEPPTPPLKARSELCVSVMPIRPGQHEFCKEAHQETTAEMALKEVLSSVQAANTRAHAEPLFDFPFFQADFPSICLYCLPPAPSLGNGVVSEPFEVATTWSSEPPNHTHLKHLRFWLHSTIKGWKARQGAAFIGKDDNISLNHIGNYHEQSSNTTLVFEPSDPHQQHLTSQYQNYAALNTQTKHELWHNAFANHLALEQRRHREMKSRLQLLEQEVHALSAQLHSKGGNFYMPLQALPLSKQTTEELHSGGGLHQWDYNRILSRWGERLQRNDLTQVSPQPLQRYSSETDYIGTFPL